MLKDFVDRILSLAPPQTVQVNELPYSSEKLSLVEPPVDESVEVVTLTGVVELIKGQLDNLELGAHLIHVISPEQVRLIGRTCDPFGRRHARVIAELTKSTHWFGQWMAPEVFIIWLQSGFVPERGELTDLLRLVSSLTAEAVSLSEDDGISQKAITRRGVAFKQEVVIKPRVPLAPYRTFREVAQPMSDFLLRLRRQDDEDGLPSCALFEADGGRWKLEAMLAIKQWLEDQNLGMPVIA